MSGPKRPPAVLAPGERMSPEAFLGEWIGTPYRFDGNDRSGIDCYGLVRRYYQDVLGVTLPDWTREENALTWYADVITRETARLMRWIPAPMDGAIAVAQRARTCHHMGIVHKGYILHCTSKDPVCLISMRAAQIYFGGAIRYGFPL